MKKSLLFLLILMLCLFVAACSFTNGTAETGSQQQDHTEGKADETMQKTETAPGIEMLETSYEMRDGISEINLKYSDLPEDVSTDGVDAVAGASIVVKDGEKLGNTEYVAKLIQQTIGGDLFRIETVGPYPLAHNTLVDQADEEKADGLGI